MRYGTRNKGVQNVRSIVFVCIIAAVIKLVNLALPFSPVLRVLVPSAANMMLIVQDQVWNRVTANRAEGRTTRYYMDEFHLLLKEEQTAAYSVEIWKRFRKWGGIRIPVPTRSTCWW